MKETTRSASRMEHTERMGRAERAGLTGRMGRLFRWPLAMATALVLLCGTSFTAHAAADSPSLDWSQSGSSSIAVELEDDGGNAVADGTLTLYQVALLGQDDGNMVYTFAEAFADCGVSLDDVSVDSSSLAAELSDYAAANGIAGTSVENANGTVVFDGLELGLYLVVQTTQSDGYYTMNPFVVSVPLDEDGAWVYDVDASPKVGVLTAVPEASDEATPAASTLPQTGQLNWPIPVLVVGGLLLVGLGCLMVRSDRRKAAVG